MIGINDIANKSLANLDYLKFFCSFIIVAIYTEQD